MPDFEVCCAAGGVCVVCAVVLAVLRWLGTDAGPVPADEQKACPQCGALTRKYLPNDLKGWRECQWCGPFELGEGE